MRTDPHARGFTLIEVLVVIVIIGVIVSAATLAIGLLGSDREAEDESRRFWALLQQAREEAELQGIDIGVYVGATAYEFLRFDPRRRLWLPIQGDALYAPRELPEGLRFRVWLESREIVLQPQLPKREWPKDATDQSTHPALQASDKRRVDELPPQLVVMSSGEITPFELRIERDGGEALWRVVALPDDDLRVERRASNDPTWIAVAQTKPRDEQDDRA